jgi:hypothetical protein
LAKDEKVVNPPQKPMVPNATHDDWGSLPFFIMYPRKTPNIKHPTTLAVKVLQGNPFPE